MGERFTCWSNHPSPKLLTEKGRNLISKVRCKISSPCRKLKTLRSKTWSATMAQALYNKMTKWNKFNRKRTRINFENSYYKVTNIRFRIICSYAKYSCWFYLCLFYYTPLLQFHRNLFLYWQPNPIASLF